MVVLKVVVLISGGGSNLKALLDATVDPSYPVSIVAVGSDTDAAGLRFAEAAGVPTFVVRPADYPSRAAWGEALSEQISQFGVHTEASADAQGLSSVADRGLVVSAGLMRILPAGFVNDFSPRLMNTHPALLPLFPGAHAVRDALAAGAVETGVTVHVIDEGVDTGPVLRQALVAIEANESESDLHERIKTLERPLLVRTIRDIATGDLRLPGTP